MGKQPDQAATRTALAISINGRLPALTGGSGNDRFSILPHSYRCCSAFEIRLKHLQRRPPDKTPLV